MSSIKWTHLVVVVCFWQLIFTPSVESKTKAKTNVVTNDIPTISQYWGNLRPYSNLDEDAYGVMNTGLPEGCQVEQVQVLHRHGARYPSHIEFAPMAAFAAKVAAKAAGDSFRGPLAFLNTWSLRHGQELLIPSGVSMLHTSGTDFWSKYGRILYSASVGQPFYNATGATKPLIRSNTAPRVLDSARAWAEGFFGQYNATDKYSILIIPIGTKSNNTLSSFTHCYNFATANTSINKAQPPPQEYASYYLRRAKARLSRFTPASVKLSMLDIFAMQSMCPYDYVTFGSSDFCGLFTIQEWQGFEYTLDTFVYNTFSFGFPTGRAVGIGTLQEMIARLKGEYITTSQTSVNTTLDSNPDTFPLNQKFYADFTHEFVILGTLTAMSLDYFRRELPYSFPPPLKRTFRMSRIAPFGARLITEKIGCTSATPTARASVTHYTGGQYGYSSGSATFKFVRMKLNNGILPLNTIRGGLCDIANRTDGLCPLDKFLESQENAEELANYQYVCYGNFTYRSDFFEGDGTYSAKDFRANYTIGWMEGAPDGYKRSILAVNNQFPAPTITVNRGDIAYITFKNLADVGTTMHFHGIDFEKTPEMDGVPGITQCAIAPNDSFTYAFNTEGLSGTYWYHSHSSVQYADGLKGAFIIQDPNDPWKSSYQDEEVLQCTDWYHTLVSELVGVFATSKGVMEPPPDSGLINDIGQFNCKATNNCSYYRATIRAGTTKRFRIINTGVYSTMTLSIDDHDMKVIEADGVTLDGSTTTRALRISPGQRYSVLVTAKTSVTRSYWIRLTIHPFPTFTGIDDTAVYPNISAILQYVTENDPNPSLLMPPESAFNNDAVVIQKSISDGKIYADEQGLVPMDIPMNRVPTEGSIDSFVFEMTYYGQYPAPFSFNNVSLTKTGGELELGAVLAGKPNMITLKPRTTLEFNHIIDVTIINLSFGKHPLHLHGHKAWLIASGPTNESYKDLVANGNLVTNTVNPLYRDTFTVNPFSYFVIRFVANNPGVWLFHSHNDWNVVLGMGMLFVEAPARTRRVLQTRDPPVKLPFSCPA